MKNVKAKLEVGCEESTCKKTTEVRVDVSDDGIVQINQIPSSIPDEWEHRRVRYYRKPDDWACYCPEHANN